MATSKTLTSASLSKDLQALFDLDIRIVSPKRSRELRGIALYQTDLSDSCSRVPTVSKNVKR